MEELICGIQLRKNGKTTYTAESVSVVNKQYYVKYKNKYSKYCDKCKKLGLSHG
jgi:hypothetical protein